MISIWILTTIGLSLLAIWLFYMNRQLSQAANRCGGMSFGLDLEPGGGFQIGDNYATCAKDVKQIQNVADITTVETNPLYLPNGFKDVEIWHAENGPYLSVTQSRSGDSNVIQKTTPVFFPKGFRFEFVCQ